MEDKKRIMIAYHPTDSRVKIAADGKVQTLTERMGTGGGNVPLVAEPEPMTLKMRSGKPGGGKGNDDSLDMESSE